VLRFPKGITGIAVAAVLLVLGNVSGHAQFAPNAGATPGPETRRQLELLGKVLDIVRSDYVDKPDDGRLVTSAINGVLSALDPHSSYIDAKSFRDLQVTGLFAGLGMQLDMEGGLLKVVSPIDDTPAAKAGILAGDVITRLDDTPMQGLNLYQAVEMMRGAPGTEVRLEITRKDSSPLKLTLTRQIIKINAVRPQAEGGDVGYVRLTQFTSRGYEDLKQGFQALAAQIPPDQAKGYILDLRNNPGGLLDQAVRVAGAFLTSGGDIVSVRGRNPEPVQRFNAAPGDLIDGKPLIVLINGGSYSASEIVAGALQDNKRATILGSRSFGKASVQTIIPLGQGNGALRLTTARYYTPSGHSLQAQGIAPDIEVLQDVPKELAAQAHTRSESNQPGHLKAEGDEQKGSQSYIPKEAKDDKALQTALALIRGTETNPAFPPTPKQAASEH
jgi:carboxyl-terminal processing protease